MNVDTAGREPAPRGGGTPLSPMGQAALRYARDLGWRVLPLHWIRSDGTCSCEGDCGRSAGKHPRVRHGVRDASAVPAQIAAWWREWPEAGIALATSAELLVIDVDPARDGDAGLRACADRLGALPATLTCRTGSGGAHYYFTAGTGSVGNSSDRLALGVDVRATGGYVVVPPTRHKSGAVYRWEGASPGAVEIAALPERWIDALAPRPASRGPVAVPSAGTVDASRAQALAWLRTKAPIAVEGRGGSSACMTVMGALRRMGIATADDAISVLEESGWNGRCEPPWEHDGPQGLRRKFAESGAAIGEPPRSSAEPARRPRMTPRGSRWQGRPAPKAPVPSASPIGPGAEGAVSILSEVTGGEAAPTSPAPRVTPLTRSREATGERGAEGASDSEDDGRDDDAQPTDVEDWALLRDKKSGAIKGTPWNAQEVLSRDERVRGLIAWDEHRADVVIQRRPPWLPVAIKSRTYPAALTDEDIAWCGHWLQGEYGVAFRIDALCTALTAVAHLNEVHPLREWLSSLSWDGTERTEDWLCDYLGAANTELTRAFARRWLIAAVARAFEPGCKAEDMLVLEGGQGIGKSRALRVLATGDIRPAVAGVHAAWFTDEYVDVKAKDGKLTMAGAWVVEFSELGSITKAEVEPIKAFISRQVDRFRFPWARRAVDVRRGCVFAGSTNTKHYLRDPTGARRFWPVQCGDTNIEGLRLARAQLWAEAVALYRRGVRWYLEAGVDDALIAAHADLVEQRREVDPWHVLLTSWAENRDRASTRQVLDYVGIEAGKRTKADEMRAGTVLRDLGFTDHRRARDGHGPEWFYFRPFISEAR